MINIKITNSRVTTLVYTVLLAVAISHSYIERDESASFIIGWYKYYSTYADLEIAAMVAAIVIFAFYLSRIKWAYYMSASYALIMVINGIYHIIAFLSEGRAFSRNEGTVLTSIGLITLGILLFWLLRKDRKRSSK